MRWTLPEDGWHQVCSSAAVTCQSLTIDCTVPSWYLDAVKLWSFFSLSCHNVVCVARPDPMHVRRLYVCNDIAPLTVMFMSNINIWDIIPYCYQYGIASSVRDQDFAVISSRLSNVSLSFMRPSCLFPFLGNLIAVEVCPSLFLRSWDTLLLD